MIYTPGLYQIEGQMYSNILALISRRENLPWGCWRLSRTSAVDGVEAQAHDQWEAYRKEGPGKKNTK